MPFLTTALGAGSLNLSGLVSGVGTVLSGVAGAQAAHYQAKVAKMNAAISQENAKNAAADAQAQQQELDMSTLGALGEQLAIQGASGLAVSSGSSMAVRSSARRLGRKDAQKLAKRGAQRVRNFQIEAANQLASAGMFKRRGSNALLQGFLSGTGSLIGAARPTIYSGGILR